MNKQTKKYSGKMAPREKLGIVREVSELKCGVRRDGIPWDRGQEFGGGPGAVPQ